MNKKFGSSKASATKLVKTIRRKTRRRNQNYPCWGCRSPR